MKAGAFCIVADFDFRVWKFAKFLNSFNVGRTHIRSGNNPEFPAVFGEFAKFIDNKSKTAPLDE